MTLVLVLKRNYRYTNKKLTDLDARVSPHKLGFKIGAGQFLRFKFQLRIKTKAKAHNSIPNIGV